MANDCVEVPIRCNSRADEERLGRWICQESPFPGVLAHAMLPGGAELRIDPVSAHLVMPTSMVAAPDTCYSVRSLPVGDRSAIRVRTMP